jgi:hypothetical protein
VKLAEGQRETVKLKLEFDPTAAAIPADPVNQSEMNPAKEEVVPPLPGEGEGAEKPYDPLRTTGFFALGVGIIGLGVGTGFAIAAASKQSTVDELCGGDECPAGAQDEQDALDRDRAVSTIGFVAGGVLTAAGIVLLIVTSSSDPKPAPKAARRAEPLVGPGWAGVRGVF